MLMSNVLSHSIGKLLHLMLMLLEWLMWLADVCSTGLCYHVWYRQERTYISEAINYAERYQMLPCCLSISYTGSYFALRILCSSFIYDPYKFLLQPFQACESITFCSRKAHIFLHLYWSDEIHIPSISQTGNRPGFWMISVRNAVKLWCSSVKKSSSGGAMA